MISHPACDVKVIECIEHDTGEPAPSEAYCDAFIKGDGGSKVIAMCHCSRCDLEGRDVQEVLAFIQADHARHCQTMGRFLKSIHGMRSVCKAARNKVAEKIGSYLLSQFQLAGEATFNNDAFCQKLHWSHAGIICQGLGECLFS